MPKEIFISAELPEIFVEKFESYLTKKQDENFKNGGITKITKKEMIHFALKNMMDNDTYPIA